MCFNPRTRTGCDQRDMSRTNDLPSVSIHAPVRGATKPGGKGVPKCMVSIHAPVRGATQRMRSRNDIISVSIHAPVRGATSEIRRYVGSPRFQSTHPYGVRRTVPKLWIELILFQSTHPYGVRRETDLAQSIGAVFQSTHPYGVRLSTSKSGSTRRGRSTVTRRCRSCGTCVTNSA